MELTSLIYLTGLILAVVSFLLQTWPRFGNRYFGIDVWRHLAVADYYRRRRQDRTLAFNRYLIPEPSDYPPLLRIFLSLIPKETLERTQWFIGPLFDFVQSFAVFVVAYSITGSLSVLRTPVPRGQQRLVRLPPANRRRRAPGARAGRGSSSRSRSRRFSSAPVRSSSAAGQPARR